MASSRKSTGTASNPSGINQTGTHSTMKGSEIMDKIAEGFKVVNMEVARTVKQPDGSNKRVKVGDVKVPVPTLAAFGLQAAIAAEQPEGAELPLYADDKHNFLQSSIQAQCFAWHRNKLTPGTVDYQDGKGPAVDFETLLADQDGAGEGLKKAAEAAAAFEAFILSTGKTAAIAAQWKLLFRQRAALALQSATIKEKAKAYLAQFAEHLATTAPESVVRYANAIVAAQEAAESEVQDANSM